MRNLIITFVVAFVLGHYWKTIIHFVKSILPKKK